MVAVDASLGVGRVAGLLHRTVGHVINASPAAALLLQPGRVRDAQRLVAPQRPRGFPLLVGEAGREHRRALDRLGRALDVEREHGMCRVTQQRHPTRSPALQRSPVQQRPIAPAFRQRR
jgi:hypothetical protein